MERRNLSEILRFLYPDQETFLLASSAFEKFIRAYYMHRAFVENAEHINARHLKRLMEKAFYDALDDAYALSVDSFSAENGAVDYFIVPEEFRNEFTAALYRGDEHAQYVILEKASIYEVSFWRVRHIDAFSEKNQLKPIIPEETLLRELEVLASALHCIIEKHDRFVDEINNYIENNGIPPLDGLEKLSEREYRAVREVYRRVVILLGQNKG